MFKQMPRDSARNSMRSFSFAEQKQLRNLRIVKLPWCFCFTLPFLFLPSFSSDLGHVMFKQVCLNGLKCKPYQLITIHCSNMFGPTLQQTERKMICGVVTNLVES